MGTRLFQIGITAAILAAFTLYAAQYDPRWLLVRWDDTSAVPFAVEDQLEIGTKWRPLKRSSISLLCGNQGVHLMLRTRLPLPGWMHGQLEDDKRPPAFDHETRAYLGQVSAEGSYFETRSVIRFAEPGNVDTVVTAPLSATQRGMLKNWFDRGAPQRLSFMLLETGTYLKDAASAKQVGEFLAQCKTVANG